MMGGYIIVNLDITKALLDPTYSSYLPEILNSSSIEEGISALSIGIAYSLQQYGMISEDYKIKLHLISAPSKYSIEFNEIDSSKINKLIAVTGVISKVSQMKLLAENCLYKCEKCGKTQIERFVNGIFDPPKKCSDEECIGKLFRQLLDSMQTSTIMRITIQQITQTEDDIVRGKMPDALICEVRNELTECVKIGNYVQAVGIVKAELEQMKENKANKPGKSKGVFESYIEINSIVKINRIRQIRKAASDKEKSLFKLMASEPKIFYLFMQSINPFILGNNVAKAAITLALFGGTYKYKDDEEEESKANSRIQNISESDSDVEEEGPRYNRADIHLLLVGEPGIGKSEMLKRIQKILPRSFYVSAKGASNSGLTAMLTKDDLSGELVVEAGSLVLSDWGTCLVDEFDKISGDQSTLTEAMENQTITIAKGGMSFELNCRCGIIACSNPHGSNFDFKRSISDNINVDHSILSRFDIVLILSDRTAKIKDKNIAMQMVQNKIEGNKRKHSQINDSIAISECLARRCKISEHPMKSDEGFMQISDEDDGNIEDKFKNILNSIPESNYLSIPTMKAYIEYARASVFPELNDEAIQTLGLYFHESAEAHKDTQAKITIRNLETLLRLGQARAKVELRSIVTKKDIEEIIRIFNESYYAMEESNNKVNDGSQILSIPKQTTVFIEKLRCKAEIKGCKIFQKSELIEVASEMNLRVGDFSNYIDKLNNNSVLLMKGDNKYELI